MGQLVELEISNVAHGGIMVARHDSRVVFVSDAIPGETVRAVITDDSKAKFWRADTVEVLSASEHRRRRLSFEQRTVIMVQISMCSAFPVTSTRLHPPKCNWPAPTTALKLTLVAILPLST